MSHCPDTPQILTWAVGDAGWPNDAAGEIWMVFQMPPDCAMVISNWQTSPLSDQKLLLPLGLAGCFWLAFTEVF